MINIGYGINLCSKLLKNKLNKELEKEGITAAQFAVLKDIQINNTNLKNTTAVLIADRLKMDKPTISGIVNRLVSKDYIKKIPNLKDKRSSILVLTEKCNEKLDRFEEINEEIIKSITKGIENKELEAIDKVLNKIIDTLKEEI